MADDEKQVGSKVATETVVQDKTQLHDYDSESHSAVQNPDGKLKRQLKNRHIAMIRCVIQT